jgi:hypothetical protein
LCGSVQRLCLCRLMAALPRLLGMLFLPGVDPWVVMVTREDPAEDAEPWLPAPAVRVAVARKETGCLPGAVVQGEGRVTQDQDGEELLHAPEARSESPKRQGCRAGLAFGLTQHPDKHRPESPVFLAVDLEFGEGTALRVRADVARHKSALATEPLPGRIHEQREHHQPRDNS